MKRVLLAASAGLLALSMSSVSVAADAEGQIKYRKSVMKAVGGHMGAMAGIMKGNGDAANLPGHAHAMAELAKTTHGLFPAGSDFGDTTALIDIWDKPDEFAKAVKAFQDASAAVAKASTGGDMAAFGAAFGAMGKTCKGCHETFREKKDKGQGHGAPKK